MKQYIESLKTIINEGVREPSRTGVDRIRYHGIHYRFDLSKGLPIVTTKKMATQTLIKELLWFMRGESNIRPLLEEGVKIWTPDAMKKFFTTFDETNELLRDSYTHYDTYEKLKKLEYKERLEYFEKKILNDDSFARLYGELGPVYGVQWRKRSGRIDQIMNAINQIKYNPTSSRIIIDAWNPEEIHLMTLPPCHYSFQLTTIDGKLNLHLNQRSGDMFLGVPFNITSYSILLEWLAALTNTEAGILTHTIGDAHIYANHLESVEEQIKRFPLVLPKLKVDTTNGLDFDKYTIDDFKIVGYTSHGKIHGELSV